MNHATKRGFTILEVLVALMVIAVSLGAVVATVASVSRNETQIESKVFARWVAMNQLEKLQIEQAWPAIGTSTGTEEMARRKWKWSQKTIGTNDKNIRRVEVSVSLPGGNEEASIMMVGFIHH